MKPDEGLIVYLPAKEDIIKTQKARCKSCHARRGDALDIAKKVQILQLLAQQIDNDQKKHVRLFGSSTISFPCGTFRPALSAHYQVSRPLIFPLFQASSMVIVSELILCSATYAISHAGDAASQVLNVVLGCIDSVGCTLGSG